MPAPRLALLLVTDLSYPAQGRRYGDEDIALASCLRSSFDVAMGHPLDAAALMDGFDLVLVRNSGPVLHYAQQHADFRARALASGTRVFNSLDGQADMIGKDYLLELFGAGYPVIPTVDRVEDLSLLPEVERYVVKPRLGADSVGMRVLGREELGTIGDADLLIQPHIPFSYEVSFCFIGSTFQYALHAPDPARRWELVEYAPTEADLAFAQRFVDWNPLSHGIQRVDACRTLEGELLLVELEDLNPYLSLDRISAEKREAFIGDLTRALLELGESSAREHRDAGD